MDSKLQFDEYPRQLIPGLWHGDRKRSRTESGPWTRFI